MKNTYQSVRRPLYNISPRRSARPEAEETVSILSLQETLPKPLSPPQAVTNGGGKGAARPWQLEGVMSGRFGKQSGSFLKRYV